MAKNIFERLEFPLILFLFLCSGCAALIYEIIWLKLLGLVIGASAVSFGLLLATYMGGLLLGSLFFAKLVPERLHPIKVYAVLEGVIGIVALIIPSVLPIVRGVYTDVVGYGIGSILLRGVLCCSILLIPTTLMGATLPAISRWFEHSKSGVGKLGLLYGFNITGAVLGAAITGFVLLPNFGIKMSNLIAVGLNAGIFVLAWVLAAKLIYRPVENQRPAPSTGRYFHLRTVYIVTAISGFTALGAQIIWTRILSNMYGVTTFTFTILISVFLTGLALGSAAAAHFIRRTDAPHKLLYLCQLLLIPATGYAAYMIAFFIPENAIVIADNIGDVHRSNILNCFLAILPCTLLWGASFPLCVATVGFEGRDPAEVSGKMYAANTIGSIVGSLIFSLFAIPLLGTQFAQWIIVFLLAVSVILMLRAVLQVERSDESSNQGGSGKFAAGLIILAVLIAGSLFYIRPISNNLMAFGLRHVAGDERKFAFISEGINSTVAVQDIGDRYALHVSGRIVASTIIEDLKILRMLGHVPGIMHQDPKSVLIVGMGTGTTAGAFINYPSIERVVICEIEPAVYQAAKNYFGRFNHDAMTHPKVEVVFDDARHFLATTKETFDVITSDPIHPWVRGAAALYSDEYYQLVKDHLNPGGVVTQWVPLYETNMDGVKIQMKTFFENFTHSSVWMANLEHGIYDAVLVGHLHDPARDLNTTQRLISDNPGLDQSLGEVDLNRVENFFGTYICSGDDLRDWVRDTPLNLDDNMSLEYVAGMAINSNTKYEIFKDMVQHCSVPDFLGPKNDPRLPGILQQVRENWQK